MGFHNKCIFSLALKVCFWWLLFDKLELTIRTKLCPDFLPSFSVASMPSLSTHVYFGGGEPRAWHLNSTLLSSEPRKSNGFMIQLGGSWTWTELILDEKSMFWTGAVKFLRTKRSQLNQIFYPHLLTSSLMSLSSSSPVCGTLARQVKVPALLLETSLMRRPSLSITYWSPKPIKICVLKC